MREVQLTFNLLAKSAVFLKEQFTKSRFFFLKVGKLFFKKAVKLENVY